MQISTMRIDELDKLHIKKIGEKKLPEFSPGDTLKVNVRIIEGKRQRIQAYEGVCIAKKNALNPWTSVSPGVYNSRHVKRTGFI